MLTVAASLVAGALAGGAGAQNRAVDGAADKATEDKLVSALASREMDGLLDYYFKKHNVPADRQAAIRSLSAWREMNNPNLPAARRRQLLLDGVKGIKNFIASTKDSELLMTRAGQLIEFGMKPQITQVEYFGETPKSQAALNEFADAVMKLLDKTIEECEAQENQVLAGQTRPNPQVMAKWQALDDRLNTARWTKAFASYGLALSMDPADAKRKETADAALTFLKDFEDPQYQREAIVKLQMGKLNLAKGDTAAALAKFNEALKAPGIDKPSQFEAMFGIVLANLTAKKADPAAAALGEVRQWVEANFQGEDAKFALTGTGLLDYRINELRASQAQNADEKRKFAEAGDAALSKVMADNPRTAPAIKRLMLEKLPADADLTKVDTTVLQSLMAPGVDEVTRAKEGTPDEKSKAILRRALQASVEIQKRKGKPGTSADAVDMATFTEPYFWAKLGDHARAIEEARSDEPGVEVTGSSVPGGAAKAILDAAEPGDLVVVGSRGHSALAAATTGSTCQQVATHANTSVLVVQGRPDPGDGPVVVGHDGSAGADGVLEAAFAAAAARDTGLTVMRAFHRATPVLPADAPPPKVFNARTAQASLSDELTRLTRPLSDKYPDVDVKVVVADGDAAQLLVDASHRAQLVVVGSRGHGGFAGLLLGSVGMHLIHHAHCPVLVARG